MKKMCTFTIAVLIILSVVTVNTYAGDSYSDIFKTTQQEYSNSYKQKFWDVDKSHWAFEAIAELANRGAISGYDDGSFKPDNTVTRAEWAKIMIQAAGLSANDYTVRFTDMNGHWAAPYVNAAANYLTAFSDNSYKPDQAVTREDVTMAMVKLKGYDLNSVDYSYLSEFKDVASISNSIKVYVAIAVEKGLISGFEDKTFRGQATLSRAQAATLLWRAFQFGNDNKTSATSVPNSTLEPQVNPIPGNSASNPITNNPQATLTTNNICGTYSGVDLRAMMEIREKNGIYKIKIGNVLNAWENYLFYFDAHIDKSTGLLVYTDGYKFKLTSNEDGTTSHDLIDDKCEGTFALKDNLLTWNDISEDLSAKCQFSKSTTTFDNPDIMLDYYDAIQELQKYLNICMSSENGESSTEKERRIYEEYNSALGMLLFCSGYEDSDELIEKLYSVHNVALKLPNSMNVTNSDISFYNCTSSMRDTKLYVNNKNPLGSSTQMTLNFAYDKSSFDSELKNVHYLSDQLDKYLQLITSLFADNYSNREFVHLLETAVDIEDADDLKVFELYYGGYNITATIEYYGRKLDMSISGKKGAKKTTETYKSTSSSPSTISNDKSNTNVSNNTESTKKPSKNEYETTSDEIINESPDIELIDFPYYTTESPVTINGIVSDDHDSPKDIKVTVNGNEVSVSKSGNWSYEMYLANDKNEINITATDSKKSTTTKKTYITFDQPLNYNNITIKANDGENENSNDESGENTQNKYHYVSYYAKSSTGSIYMAGSKELVLSSIKYDNGELVGKIEFYEKRLSEYKGERFLDSDTGIYYYLNK